MCVTKTCPSPAREKKDSLRYVLGTFPSPRKLGGSWVKSTLSVLDQVLYSRTWYRGAFKQRYYMRNQQNTCEFCYAKRGGGSPPAGPSDLHHFLQLFAVHFSADSISLVCTTKSEGSYSDNNRQHFLMIGSGSVARGSMVVSSQDKSSGSHADVPRYTV